LAAADASAEDPAVSEAAEVLVAAGEVSAAIQRILARMADSAAQEFGRQALVVDDLRRAAAAASTLAELVTAASGGLPDR
jgi:hypothetical protein